MRSQVAEECSLKCPSSPLSLRAATMAALPGWQRTLRQQGTVAANQQPRFVNGERNYVVEHVSFQEHSSNLYYDTTVISMYLGGGDI